MNEWMNFFSFSWSKVLSFYSSVRSKGESAPFLQVALPSPQRRFLIMFFK